MTSPNDPGHGNSVAAWTAVAVISLGALVSAIGVGVAVPWLFYAGLVVCLLGIVVGKVLSMMGFGVATSAHSHAASDASAPAAAAGSADH